MSSYLCDKKDIINTLATALGVFQATRKSGEYYQPGRYGFQYLFNAIQTIYTANALSVAEQYDEPIELPEDWQTTEEEREYFTKTATKVYRNITERGVNEKYYKTFVGDSFGRILYQIENKDLADEVQAIAGWVLYKFFDRDNVDRETLDHVLEITNLRLF